MTRALLLAACVATGTLTGLGVELQWATDWGYLAIPALVALAWLVVADPSHCDHHPVVERENGSSSPRQV